MFDADRPIQSKTQDRLNRAMFANYLARCMLDHKDPESLVVGLYGGWGTGKTSLINLTVEELNFAATNIEDPEKPIILNFSPWSYSGQNQLIYSFFRRLSSALRNEANLKNANRIIHLLELYVSFFTQKPVPRSLRTKRTLWQKLTLQGREEVYAWESGRDLTLVKAELNQLLREQKRKIIIIIDNISRLYGNEIMQVFQIVKSIGDYANTVFLLAMDKDHVIHAVNKIQGGGGVEFVEKVVQLSFDVPPISAQDLEAIFADKLNPIIATLPEDSWNIEYWADIYHSSMKYYFKNCRDITRYVNTLNFGYSRLRDVVNPVDFFALTAVEVFTPEVYAGIRDNKDLFTDLLEHVYHLNDEEIKKEKLRCDEILSRDVSIKKDLQLQLLLRLFPRLRHIYQPDLAFYHSDTIARQLRRVCSPDLFDAYFRLSLQSSQIPEAEFETIITLATNMEAFDQALSRLNQDDRILPFLDLLDNGKFTDNVPKKNIPVIVHALLDNGDLFPQGIVGPLSLDTPMRIHRIIHHLLRRYNTSDERFMVLQEAIAKSNKSLYMIVDELHEQEREHMEEEDTFIPLELRDLEPDQLSSLKKLAVTCIEKWAKSGRLAEHPHLIPILYAWLQWGNATQCQQFVEQLTSTDRGLIMFLTQTLDKAISQAMVSREKNPAWNRYLDDISVFIAAKMLEAHAKTLFEDEYFEKLREREQLALMIFLDLVKAQTNKKIPKTSG